jgi:hypothetical protein
MANENKTQAQVTITPDAPPVDFPSIGGKAVSKSIGKS